MDSAQRYGMHGENMGTKALLHLVPRSVPPPTFEARVHDVASVVRGLGKDFGAEVNVLFRVEGDPLGRRTLFRATLELSGGESRASTLVPLAESIGTQLDDCVHRDLSSFLIGDDVTFVSPPRSPVRYQYLMRRDALHTHAAYLEYYRQVHSRFGIETPGIEGYVQFHVDPVSSREAARAGGFGVWAVDSVSQLYLESVETFISAVSRSKVGPEAAADERTFVDRSHSFDFISRVEWDES